MNLVVLGQPPTRPGGPSRGRALLIPGRAAPLGAWRAEMYRATGRRKRAEPRTYRDGPDAPWSDEAAREEAREEARSLGFEVMERNACEERNA